MTKRVCTRVTIAQSKRHRYTGSCPTSRSHSTRDFWTQTRQRTSSGTGVVRNVHNLQKVGLPLLSTDKQKLRIVPSDGSNKKRTHSTGGRGGGQLQNGVILEQICLITSRNRLYRSHSTVRPSPLPRKVPGAAVAEGGGRSRIT